MTIQSHVNRVMQPVVWAIVLILGVEVASLEAKATDGSAQADRARAVVEEAIRLGVPLFNDGQPAACAAVYRIALRSLLLLAPAAVDEPGIERALRASINEDPQRAAWTLRYALDEVYSKTAGAAMMSTDDFRIDFGSQQRAAWYVVNDNVMGGVSRGGLRTTEEGTGEFAGRLSLANNGGFSSVRTRIDGAKLAAYDGVEMRVRGDGRMYKLLAGPANARGSWQQSFRADDQWQTIRVPFDTMELSVRGWRPPSAPTLTGRDVGMLGLLVADKQTRPFRLEIDWIQGFVEGDGAVQ